LLKIYNNLNKSKAYKEENIVFGHCR